MSSLFSSYQKQYDDSSVEQSIENAKSAVLKVVDGKNSWVRIHVPRYPYMQCVLMKKHASFNA